MGIPFLQQKKNIAEINEIISEKKRSQYEFLKIVISYGPNVRIMCNPRTGEKLGYSPPDNLFQHRLTKDENLLPLSAQEGLDLLKKAE